MKILVLALSLAMQAALLAHAESAVPTPTGIGIKDYPWQALAGETTIEEVLRVTRED